MILPNHQKSNLDEKRGWWDFFSRNSLDSIVFNMLQFPCNKETTSGILCNDEKSSFVNAWCFSAVNESFNAQCFSTGSGKL